MRRAKEGRPTGGKGTDARRWRAGNGWGHSGLSPLGGHCRNARVIWLLKRVLGPTFPMGHTTPRCAQTDQPEPGESWSQKDDPEGV